MSDKTIVAIGGGEIKQKTTLQIDESIAEMAKQRAGGKRANALFLGTASHDFMPYFNSFRKTYTSVFDLKAEVALCVYQKTEKERLEEKFALADMIYVGGGDTVFMLKTWKENGITPLIMDAYERGVIISGLSAGAVCWFGKMYTDSQSVNPQGGDKYNVYPALGLLNGFACPHYNERVEDFDSTLLNFKEQAYCMENNSAIVFKNGKLEGCLSSGGKAFLVNANNGCIEKTEIKPYR